MKVRIRLLGTLPSYYPGPYTTEGIEIEIPPESTVADLVDATGIDRRRVAIVTINGLLAKSDDRVPENAVAKLMQPVAGG